MKEANGVRVREKILDAVELKVNNAGARLVERENTADDDI